jgi:hypothetical protein
MMSDAHNLDHEELNKVLGEITDRLKREIEEGRRVTAEAEQCKFDPYAGEQVRIWRDEYEALKARCAALEAVLRELVEDPVAGTQYDVTGLSLVCNECGGEIQVFKYVEGGKCAVPGAEDNLHDLHYPDCAIERARRLIARTGGGEGEG